MRVTSVCYIHFAFLFLYFLYFVTSTTDVVSFSEYPNNESLPEESAAIQTFKITSNEIINVTCIVGKYGTGYIGNRSTTYDGIKCLDWTKNIILYRRYRERGLNMTKNYCRNPDADSSGPWCFITTRSFRLRNFKFKPCGIPQCKSKLQTKDFTIGFKLLVKRDCPIGFRKIIIDATLESDAFCVAETHILDKLPQGRYSFEVFNGSNSICPEGFSNESINFTFLCTRTSNVLEDIIDFPKYLTAKSGDLIFAVLRNGKNASCPQMSMKTSVVIRQYSSSSGKPYILCYYYYKLSNNKNNIDNKLAVLVMQKECPSNWSLTPMTFRWKFMIKVDYSLQRYMVYACVPNNDIYNYPDGDYCLISLSQRNSSQKSCPNDFIDVDVKSDGGTNTRFCCRQSKSNVRVKKNIYEFFNFSSILIITSNTKCAQSSNDPDLQIKSYYFEAISYRETLECIKCEMFSSFIYNEYKFGRRWKYYKVQFHACSYERAISGFAYATLNSRCPTEMKYGYVKYTRNRYSVLYGNRITTTLCTVVNYRRNLTFPDGKYCIYKLGNECPVGFISVKSLLPLHFYRFSDSGGDLTNYQMDVFCCKMNSSSTFANQTLPYVTSTFEFGLPYANDSFSCIHGLDTHTAVEDPHMCHYYPTTDRTKGISVVFPASICDYKSYRYTGSYRTSYSASSMIRYCYFYVNKNPPPGSYCAPFSKTCPTTYFYYVTYHPLMQRVICCRKPTPDNQKEIESKFSPFKWANEVKSFSLLAFKKKCPIFERYNYGKEPLKRFYSYYTPKLTAAHRKNLTDIGFEVSHIIKGFNVAMYSCDYKLDPYNKSVIWPHGHYAFPRPLNGCPSHFKSGNFTHAMETVNPSFAHSDVIHLDGDYMIGGSVIKWGFCVKKDNYQKEKLFLPYGRYCLMKVDYSCPSSFSEGSVKFVEITALNNFAITREGALPKIDTDGPFISYYFCCQSGRGDVAHLPMYLPTESGPFYLMKFGTYCQKVFGMRVTEEFFCIDSEDSSQYLNYTFQSPYKTEGLTPVTGSFVRGCDFQINLCYYEKNIPIPQSEKPKMTSMVSWPKGSYVFIKPLRQKCPTGFDEGRVTVLTFFKFHPTFMHIVMFGSNDENNAIFSFCKRNSSIVEEGRPVENWPVGDYCFIFEKKCPLGMLRHKLRSLEHFIPKRESGAYMNDWSSLCCMKNKTPSYSLPYFPGDFYSIVLKPSIFLTFCPRHNNTRVALIDSQNEIICYYERIDESVDFPDGDYLLPPPMKPTNSCVEGFKLVTHRHTHLNGEDVASKNLKFCQKNRTSGNSTGIFPRGNYCVLTTSYSCPSAQFTIQSVLTIPNFHFDEPPYRFSRYLACCQNDDKIISNLVSTKIPMNLYGTSKCSYVEGLVNVKLTEVPTILIQQSDVERPPYVKGEKKLRICQYDQTNLWSYETRCQCHPNATCLLSLDQKNCNCRPGFIGDGVEICVKVTNETDQCGNACAKNMASCRKTKTMDTYACFCLDGYEGNGFKCKPSCNTRHCNIFSHCIVDSSGSHCACKPGAVLSVSGQCYGDLSNTIAHLPEFDFLLNMNLKCFTTEVINHLTNPDNNRTLFILYPINEYFIFSSCKNIRSHFGFYEKNMLISDPENEFKIILSSQSTISVIRNKKNEWTINKKIKSIRQDIFSNAVVLYFNQSMNSIAFDELEPSKSQFKASGSIFTISISLAVLIVILLVGLTLFIIRKKRSSEFSRLYETRSESNIHFITADEKVEID